MTSAPRISVPSHSFKFRPMAPALLLADPTAIEHAAMAYLHMTMPNGPGILSDDHPTPEGLARCMGFSSFAHLRLSIERRIKATPAAQSAEEDYFDPVIHTILAACSDLQDYYLKHGLSNTINTAMAKFISSAYFQINETKESNVTSHTTEDRSVTIRIASIDPATPQIAEEMTRLNDHLTDQTTNELLAMNRTQRRTIHGKVATTIEDLL